MVTSSAVVGSSAISSFGLQASAIAIITRWRMPPEAGADSCATRSRDAGCRPAAAARSRARAPAPRRRLSCSRIASMIWSPTVKTGFSEVIGSWKIIEISLPRICRISRGDRPVSSPRPASRMLPPQCARRPGQEAEYRKGGHALAAAGFPDNAMRFASLTVKETPSTARTRPALVTRCVLSPSTRSTGSEPAPGAGAPPPLLLAEGSRPRAPMSSVPQTSR